MFRIEFPTKKTVGAHVYIPIYGVQRFIYLKYYMAHKWESLFQYNIIFEIYQSLELRSTTVGGDRRVRSLTFIFDIMSIFGSVEPWSESLSTRLRSRRVVMRLVVVYIRSFVPSLIQLPVFNIFWPNLKCRKKKVPRRF